MTAALPRARRFASGRPVRFDPRFVLLGVVILVAGTLLGFGLASSYRQQAGEVAQPVQLLCQQGGPAGSALADTGACRAAADVSAGVGPYQTPSARDEATDGVDGRNGADSQVPGRDGRPGAASQVPGRDGTNGTTPACLSESGQCRGTDGNNGTDGTDGTDGTSPACLSEPGQCRGAPGKPGDPGAPGAPGRGITGSEQDPDDPCTRIVSYSDNTSERWNTCPPTMPDGPEPPP